MKSRKHSLLNWFLGIFPVNIIAFKIANDIIIDVAIPIGIYGTFMIGQTTEQIIMARVTASNLREK